MAARGAVTRSGTAIRSRKIGSAGTKSPSCIARSCSGPHRWLPSRCRRDENNLLAVATGSATNFYLSLRACASELHCIGDQINQHQAQQGTVSPYHGQRMSLPDNIAPLRLGLSIAHYLLDQLIEVDLLLLQLYLSDAREGQQVINQRSHLPRRPGNRRQVPETLFGK